MANPLVVGVLALLATSITFMWWVITEPIIASMVAVAEANVNEQAIPLILSLQLQYYAIPIAISILLWVWAFLAATKRLVVTQPK